MSTEPVLPRGLGWEPIALLLADENQKLIMRQIEHPLSYWKNPQGRFKFYLKDDCLVCDWDCWNERGDLMVDQQGRLIFLDVFSLKMEKQLDRTFMDDAKEKSAVIEVLDSDWVTTYHQRRFAWDAAWRQNSKKIRHFYVDAHDAQLHVLASDFLDERVPAFKAY